MPIECPQGWCARTQIKTVRGESALYLATHESPAQKRSISVNVAPADIAYIESFKGKVRLWEDDDQDYVLKGDGGARFAGLVLLAHLRGAISSGAAGLKPPVVFSEDSCNAPSRSPVKRKLQDMEMTIEKQQRELSEARSQHQQLVQVSWLCAGACTG